MEDGARLIKRGGMKVRARLVVRGRVEMEARLGGGGGRRGAQAGYGLALTRGDVGRANRLAQELHDLKVERGD